MTIHFYAIRVEERRLVAAEIDPPAAAALLDAAHPLLLGTAEDLAKVAQRLRRPLVTIARSESRPLRRRDLKDLVPSLRSCRWTKP